MLQLCCLVLFQYSEQCAECLPFERRFPAAMPRLPSWKSPPAVEVDVALRDIPPVPTPPIGIPPSHECVPTAAMHTSSEGGDSPPKKARKKPHTKKAKQTTNDDHRSPRPSHHLPESHPTRQVQEAWVTTAPDATAAAQMSLSPVKRPHGFQPAPVLGEPILPPLLPPSQDSPSPSKPLKTLKPMRALQPSPQRPQSPTKLHGFWRASAAFKPSKVSPADDLQMLLGLIETPEEQPEQNTEMASEEATDMGE